jgi:DNA processing protein
MIDTEDLAAWLRLLETPGVGRETARRLLGAFGSAPAVMAARPAALREVAGAAAAQALARRPEALEAHVAATMAWLASAPASRRIVTLGDPLYPAALLEAADPPLLLHVEGRTDLLHAPCVAVVGSRNPTAQGAANARALAGALSQAGLTVVSGLALGVDGAAHEGALDAAASTIAVVGTGLDIVYPRRHLGLARRIARHGLLLSEYSLGTPSLAFNFPRRNRIIAGLARGTLVVEATLRSGSLITARLAAEAGRDVFAVPGSIHSPQSRGCHLLIKQGAKLVDGAADVLEELHWPSPASSPAEGFVESAAAPQDPVLEALGYDPVSLDAVLARTGCTAGEAAARLLALELDGHVARLPGQLFQRVPVD